MNRIDAKTRKVGGFATRSEAAADADMDHHLTEHHDEIEAKLDEARAEIAAGKSAPLEPLADLLRQARKRRRSKSVR